MTGDVAYRRADGSDIERTYEVMLEANEELNSRLHRTIDIEDTAPPTRALAVRRSGLRYDPERFWVAEAGGRIVGFGLATMRRHLWYLAALHVIPDYQSRGIGRELLRRCLAGEAPGATRLTITEAEQPVSNALYGRFGMFPQVPILQLEGRARDGAGPASELHSSIINVGDCAGPDLARVDEQIFGTARPEDHECWLGMPTMQGLRLIDGDQTVGYLYLDGNGVIGPLATNDQRYLVPAIQLAARAALERRIDVVRARVPGVARLALAHLLNHGFRIGPSIYLLLTSKDIEGLDRYLFSGGDALY
jgi:GNAT superfamily N-acetyltransferase